MELKLIDKRVVDRNLSKGLLATADYNKYMAELPDLADACEEVTETLFGGGEEEAEAEASSDETESEV